MADIASDVVEPVVAEEPQINMNVDGDVKEAGPQDPGKRKREEGDEEVDDNKKTKADEGDAAAVQNGDGAAEMDESGGDAAEGGEGQKGEGGESDVLKIMVYGFKKWDNQHQVSSWLAKNNVKYDKLKRIPHTSAAQLRFETKDERDAAMEHLKTALYKGKTLFVTLGRDDANTRVRKEGEGGGDRDNGKGRDGRKGGKGKEGEGGGEGKKKTLLEVVTPLYEVPYEQQLQQKATTMKSQCVDKLLREIKHAYRTKIRQRHQGGAKAAWVEMPSYLKEGDRAIVVEPIKPAPQVMAYRNKCEFTVGRDVAGEPTVGFRLSSFEEGVTVASPEQCPNLDDHTKRVAAAMQRFIRSSRLPVWDMVENSGVWRLVTVRTSARTQQCLVLLCVSVTGVGEGAWKEEEARLRQWITAPTEPPLEPPADGDTGAPADDEEGKGSWLGVTSIFVQVFEGRSSPDGNTPVHRSWGRPYLEEELMGLKFRISPTAFFQTSTAAAEVLYGVVADWCTKPSPLPLTTTEGEGEGKARAADDGASVTTAATGGEGEGEGGGKGKAGEEGDDDATFVTATTTMTAEDGEGAQKGEGEKGEGEEGKGWEPLAEGRESVLLDVCCGTGTIGLCCASTLKHKALRVLGIEMCGGAVDDAWANAAANGVDNAAFVCCKAEEVLNGGLQPGNFCPSEPDPTNVRELLQHAVNEGSPVLAIVDPPRDGLHIDCVRSIRACECIKRLIYVSCNPTGSLVRDGLTLCSAPSKRLFGTPFRPVAAVPVDMFPHTPHCECVMIFERD